MDEGFDQSELELALQLSKQEEEERLNKKVKVEEFQIKSKNGSDTTTLELIQRVDTGKFDTTEYGQRCLQGFKNLWSNKKFSDIVLHIGKTDINAHKLVLCAWSTKMESLLQGNDAELTLNVTSSEEEKLLCKIIMFFYTGEFIIRSDDLIKMIELANFYEISSIKEQCGEILASQLNQETVFLLLQISDKYKLNKLNKSCGEYLAKNFETLIKEDKLNSLSPQTLKNMLNSDDIEVAREEDIFRAIMKYSENFSNDEKKRVEVLTLLLPVVRFTLLNGKFLITEVEENPNLKGVDSIHQLLHETYKKKAYPAAKVSLNTKWRGGMWVFKNGKSPFHNSIGVSDDQSIVSLKSYSGSPSGYTTIPIFPPFDHGRKWIEFEIVQGAQSGFMVSVGALKDLKSVYETCSSYPGQQGQAIWSYESSAGYLYHGASQLLGRPYRSGDRIGLLVDLDRGTFHIYHNGTSLPEVSSFKKYAKKVNSSNPLIFSVSLISQGESIRINRDSSIPSPSTQSKKTTNNQQGFGRGKANLFQAPDWEDYDEDEDPGFDLF